MNTNDLLTVKEFAAAAGVSTQRIYKAMKTTLQPYVANTENGLTMLKADGLREFGINHSLQLCNDVLQTESCKAQSSNNTGIDGDLPPELATQGLQPRVASDTARLIDTQAAEIETLKQQLETLQTELTAKNTQISLLQAHTAGQQKTIDSLTAALTAAQTLQAMEKQERLQLQGDTQPGGDQSEAGTASAPKRGIFARIREAWSKPPRG